MPRIQNEAVAKLMSGDILGDDEQLLAHAAHPARAARRAAGEARRGARRGSTTSRTAARYLLLVNELGRRLIQAQREWLDDVERELRPRMTLPPRRASRGGSAASSIEAGGIRTRLMTWMTPFVAITSAVVTFAPLTKTFPPATRMRDGLAVRRLRRAQLDHVLRGHLAGDDVVEQDGLQLGLVRHQRVQRRLRHLGERGVGRGEDGVRAGLAERGDEAGGLEQLGQGREVPAAVGRADDVGLGARRRGRRRGDGRGGDGREQERDEERCGCGSCGAFRFGGRSAGGGGVRRVRAADGAGATISTAIS